MTAKRTAGFLLLAATCSLLYYYALMVSIETSPLVAVVLGVVCLSLLYGFYLEWPAISAKWEGPVFPVKDLKLFLSVFVGALVSYWLNVNLGLGAVVASALVGVLAGVVVPAYGVPIYCGSFVGMASPKVLNETGIILAAAVAGVIYVLAQDVFNGFGGKLGTIACSGCILACTFLRHPLLSGVVPTWDVGSRLIVTSVVAAVAAYYVNVRMGKGAVLGSALVGLAGGLILPALFPEIGASLATVAICASFAGMSSKARIPNELLMAIAGVIVGLVFMFSSPYLGGAGGKLGTTAFGSVIAVNAAHKLASKIGGQKS
ncbi:MAG TPA: hypothetical protein GX512_00870 [Firmicutes bacterium]|nr:hypothetical protein [Candidatus Fermentithermobacillaceae bacterium]